MNIEVIEFYPIERNEDKGFLSGTLRIRIPVIKINILGIFVSKRKDSWYFGLPGRNSNHHETGEAVRYPFIVFDDQEKQKQLMIAIREKGRAFIEKKLADLENPLIFPEKQQKQPKQSNHPTTNAPEAKKVVSSANSIPVSSIATKLWRDPPKRKISSSRSYKNG